MIKTRLVLDIAGSPALLLEGRQTNSGIRFKKWMLIIGFDDFTAMVTAQIPLPVTSELQAAIDSSLRTIRSRPALTLDQKMAALPFIVGSADNMRISGTLAGNAVTLTRGPKKIYKHAEQPMVIVVRSMSGKLPMGTTAEQVSRHWIRNIRYLGGVAIEHTKDVRFAGAGGFEIVARVRDTETNKPVAVIQWVRIIDDGYLRMVGITSTANRSADFSAFRNIRDSVRIK